MRRYRLFFDGWLCATLVIGAGIGIGKAQNAAPTPTAVAAPGVHSAGASPQHGLKAIKADEEIQDLFLDRAIIGELINLLEMQKGSAVIRVSIRELRAADKRKAEKIDVWLKGHGVGNLWTYNPRLGQFEPPAPAPGGDGPPAVPKPGGEKE